MFDIEQHQRDKLRRLEQRCEALETTRDQLLRIVAELVRTQFADTPVDPLEYLNILVDIDRMTQELIAQVTT